MELCLQINFLYNNYILGGEPVFQGTRVPIKNLFDYLETRGALENFLDDFPAVTKDQAVNLLIVANRLINASTGTIDKNIA